MFIVNNKDDINKLYGQLSLRADLLYNFVMKYSQYIRQPHDYGTGLKISMSDVHTLTLIEDTQGITTSEIARKWGLTKGAISQNVSRLVEKGLVFRKKSESNAKKVNLYPTEKGVQLSLAHKLYDVKDIIQTKKDLLKNCSAEEIDTFYKVLKAYHSLFTEEE